MGGVAMGGVTMSGIAEVQLGRSLGMMWMECWQSATSLLPWGDL